MALQTFSVTVTDKDELGVFEATAREFKIKFSSQPQPDAITPEEGIVTALGTCENISAVNVFLKHHLNYDRYQLMSHFTSPDEIKIDFDLKSNGKLFPEVVQTIKDISPVYHNMTNAIPITTMATKKQN